VAPHYHANGRLCLTVDGKLLSAGYAEQGLQAWKKLPEEERRPREIAYEDKDHPRCLYTPPPGGLVLGTFARAFERDPRGELAYRAEDERRNHVVGRGPHNGTFWVTAEEANAIVPAATKKGDALPMPGSLSRRIIRYGLVPAVY